MPPSNVRQRILITGGTGLLGRALLHELRLAPPGRTPVLTYYPDREYPTLAMSAERAVLDVREAAAVDRAVDRFRPDWIVQTASLAAVDYVEKHPAECRRTNLEGTVNVARAAARTGAGMLFVSTNAIYDGEQAPYAEDAPPRPLNCYGQLKVEEEATVRGLVSRLAVVRPILMYGWNDPLERLNPLTWQLREQSAGKTITMVDDIYCNPLLANDLALVIIRIIVGEVLDTFNVGGPERMSRYQMAVRIARARGFPVTGVRPVANSSFAGIAPRPGDTTLDIGKLRGRLGFEPRNLETGLAWLAANRY